MAAWVSRGIFLDHLSWATAQEITHSPIERHAMSGKDLDAVAKAEGTEF